MAPNKSSSKSSSKSKPKSKPKSKTKSMPRRRGLLTAVENVGARGYRAGQQLGDVEIEMERWTYYIGLVFSLLIFVGLIVSIIYQISDMIYYKAKSGHIFGKELIDKQSIRVNEKTGETVRDKDGNPIISDWNNSPWWVLGATILCLICLLFMMASNWTNNKLNQHARHNSAYRAAKGAQFIGNIVRRPRNN